MGADDYVTKNMSLPHLLARVSALFRRAELLREPAQTDSIIERGPLTLDLNRFAITWRGVPVDLTLTEFWLVHALAKFPGHVKNRDQLMSEAHIVVDDSTITSHIKRIRRKFSANDVKFDCVDTVYGLGYRWKAVD
jgi:two-component system OmpR family response regulator